jgi:hypothetical protein
LTPSPKLEESFHPDGVDLNRLKDQDGATDGPQQVRFHVQPSPTIKIGSLDSGEVSRLQHSLSQFGMIKSLNASQAKKG